MMTDVMSHARPLRGGFIVCGGDLETAREGGVLYTVIVHLLWIVR